MRIVFLEALIWGGIPANPFDETSKVINVRMVVINVKIQRNI